MVKAIKATSSIYWSQCFLLGFSEVKIVSSGNPAIISIAIITKKANANMYNLSRIKYEIWS